MTTPQVSAPIVGMHFRPPAKAILAVLPGGARLALRREPENPYDENAIAVYVQPSEIPPACHEMLAEPAASHGYSMEDILNTSEWHLGYIAKEFAASWNPTMLEACAGRDAQATLVFNADGKPLAATSLTPVETLQ